MAAYPSYPILLSSSHDPESGIDDDFSQSGQQHARVFHSQQYHIFTLVHFLTLAQWTSLLATYAAGKRDTYTLTYDVESPQLTYSVKFIEPPVRVQNVGADKYFVRCVLRGTQD